MRRSRSSVARASGTSSWTRVSRTGASARAGKAVPSWESTFQDTTGRSVMHSRYVLMAPLALLAFTTPSSDTLTPEGPATLYSDWHGGQTDEGPEPKLLTGFHVVVQPGGQAGTIRFLVHTFPAYGEKGEPAVYIGAP